MKEEVKKLKNEVLKKIDECTNLKEVNELKVIYLGKKGPVNDLSMKLKEVAPEEKREFGMLLNDLKNDLTEVFTNKIKYYEELELNKKLASEQIDITLPSTKIPVGTPNILEKIVEDVESVFPSPR